MGIQQSYYCSTIEKYIKKLDLLSHFDWKKWKQGIVKIKR